MTVVCQTGENTQHNLMESWLTVTVHTFITQMDEWD